MKIHQQSQTKANVHMVYFCKSYLLSENDVRKLLHTLGDHKSTCPDGIPVNLLKEKEIETSTMLTTVFQTYLLQGKLPTEWKRAKVKPSCKRGSKSVPENYLP